MPERDLTLRQKKFIALYQGNGTEAARLAGYKGNEDTLAVTAYDLLRNPKIKGQIEKRTEKQVNRLIASKEQRQAFWTRVMNGEEGTVEMRDRLKASELLGKSEADFTDNHAVTHKLSLEDLLSESLEGEE